MIIKVDPIRKSIFALQMQIELALEETGLTYQEFAEKIGTSKSNVSRDFRDCLSKASISRLHKMANVLGQELVTVLIPKETSKWIMPEIEKAVRGEVPYYKLTLNS